MSIKVFFGFSIEARGSRCHNVLRVPAWLTNGALHFPTILRTMVPHEYPALICLPFLGNRGARCLCPCCLCSESSRVLETIIASLFTCNLENYGSSYCALVCQFADCRLSEEPDPPRLLDFVPGNCHPHFKMQLCNSICVSSFHCLNWLPSLR